MKKFRRAAAVLLGTALAAGTVAGGTVMTAASAEEESIVNIAFSNALTSLNPLNMPVSFVDLYANSMQFLPLAAFNAEYGTDGMLAESVTTEDNQTFHITLREDAVWSDGEPITADDVVWTILKLSSPEVANGNFDFSAFKGFEGGMSESGATEVEGVQKIDDTHVDFICNDHMSLDSFYNSIACWVCILPEHALKDIPNEELSGSSWFEAPEVVSGPYQMVEYDLLHYVSYTANENYFLGAPKIKKLNIQIVDPSQLLAGIESGELDMVHQSTSIPTQDRAKLDSLADATVVYSDNIINEMVYLNTASIPDARVRQAIVKAIDRDLLVQNILSGHGEVTDTFICSASPYYNEAKTKITYDPEAAKALLAEAGWDSSTVLKWNVDAGDSGAQLAAQIVQQQLAAVGVQVSIQTVDLATLQVQAGTEDADITSVQYTITPSDYYVDANWLVNDAGGYGNWTGGFYNEDLDAALQSTLTAVGHDEQQAAYDTIEEIMAEQLPLFSLYFQGNPGVVSNRLQNVEMSFFGTFNNIQDWELAE
ncbi:MAG: ABC transporter substrate-binding protein [Lachnospiraceae bacterium]|nr:ABC transporter substrate-binding protein [Lachnospiraceae bacterium]